VAGSDLGSTYGQRQLAKEATEEASSAFRRGIVPGKPIQKANNFV
jgi:hypothetical protein